MIKIYIKLNIKIINKIVSHLSKIISSNLTIDVLSCNVYVSLCSVYIIHILTNGLYTEETQICFIYS